MLKQIYNKLALVCASLALVAMISSCGGSDSKDSSDSNNAANDLIGQWEDEGDYTFDDGSRGSYSEGYEFYKGNNFQYWMVITDNEDDLYSRCTVSGTYTVENNKIKYSFNNSDASVIIGECYQESNDGREDLYDMIEFLNNGTEIISLEKAKNADDPDELTIKDGDGGIHTFEREK